MLQWQPKPGRHAGEGMAAADGCEHSGIPADEGVAAQSILFLLFPGFSLLSLSSFLVPFEKANVLTGRDLFAWRFASRDGRPVACSSGFELPVTRSFASARPMAGRPKTPGMIVLIAGDDVERQASQALSATIRMCRRQGVPIIALGTATWLLAEMGVLHGSTCTIHWEKMAAFVETFDGPKAVDAIYADDCGITSCAGEFAAFDLAAGLIEKELGARLAGDVCTQVVTDRPRDASFPQNRAARVALGCRSGKLEQAVRLMEQNLQEPIGLGAISRRLTVSRRQIERLFATHLGATPHKYYLKLRLDRARQLLEGTGLPIVEVAIACGFVSPSHFTKCFRQHHKVAPTDVRRRATAPPALCGP